jgi:hypothetical protein
MNKIAYPFPLSTGDMCQLYMPLEMSKADAKRLRRMISALYINGRKEATDGTTT